MLFAGFILVVSNVVICLVAVGKREILLSLKGVAAGACGCVDRGEEEEVVDKGTEEVEQNRWELGYLGRDLKREVF
jgi:hypothetical protein